MPESKQRVLIIDDEPLVAEITRTHVEATGREARYTPSPDEFFAWHREWRPDFVVVDLVMEKVDGLEVLRRLAEEGSDASVVIASGIGARVLDAARRFAEANGLAIAGVLPKPFKRADLVAILGNPTAPVRTRRSAGDDASAEWDDDELLRRFREALTAGIVRVAMQPKFSCVTGDVVGYEVLSRWHDAVAGPLSPAAFVPRLEQLGAAPELTDYVLRFGLAWFRRNAYESGAGLAINVSASEIADDTLPARLREACKHAHVDTGRVTLELTETAALEDPVRSLETLTRLRLEGFLLSLDDYGTGYASLRQLAEMPFSEVKVDRSFVMAASREPEAAIMVKSTIELAHALDLECTAEGVEDVATLALLVEAGCDLAQGFLLGRPMTAAMLSRWSPPAHVFAQLKLRGA